MSTTNFHFLDARGRLALNRPWLTRTINDAVERVRVLADPGDLDVAVCPDPEVPGETGHAGQCLGPGQILLNVDPSNPALTRNRNGALQRTVSHELYLSMRAEGPGYGATLGEGLVSEGLALHFEAMAYGDPDIPEGPDLEAILTPALREAVASWDSRVFDREAWFAGPKGRAIGHALGYRIVGQALRTGRASAVDAANWPAERFVPRRHI